MISINYLMSEASRSVAMVHGAYARPLSAPQLRFARVVSPLLWNNINRQLRTSAVSGDFYAAVAEGMQALYLNDTTS